MSRHRSQRIETPCHLGDPVPIHGQGIPKKADGGKLKIKMSGLSKESEGHIKSLLQ